MIAVRSQARRRRDARWGLLVMAGYGLWAGGAVAQTGTAPAVSTPVVQALPESNDPHRALSNALTKLARNPRDVEALNQAGDAALALGDVQAATGFLSRADRLQPYTPRIMASLASARLRAQDPVTALGLFEDAAKAGALGGDQIADWGLAYDLVSDNVTAQRYYREALAAGAGDEAARRLALSLAIVGDRRAVETVLAPLLQKQDRGAWRIRAFALAILGREEEAVAIANSTMPPELASAMGPYLRYMRKLTPAQQAAAANLGFFPQASQIGQDTVRIAEWVSSHGLKRPAVVEEPQAPAGEPRLAVRAEPAPKDKRKTREADVLPPDPKPSREAAAPVPVELAAGPAPEVRRAAPRVEAPKPVVATPAAVTSFDLSKVAGPARPVAAPGAEEAVPRPVAVAPEPKPEPMKPVEAPKVEVVKPQPAPQPAPKPLPKPAAKKPSFAELFEDLGQAKASVTPASGAVDIRKIQPARPAPKAPPPPAHPSRIWVQVAVGRDADRMIYDWRKMVREEPELFKAQKPSVSEWGRTNRLLVGPFETEAAAKAYNDKLHKGDHAGTFVWVSPAGQVVDLLDGK
jgi:Flp pilus assembly protein TadD